ncbi:MAG: hypothetical protein GY818_04660 [Planctomycetaceae bacterium]|nr:hypothetical protein [Planctomycetaceae bacterium]
MREKQTLMLSALVELCSALAEIDAFERLIFGKMWAVKTMLEKKRLHLSVANTPFRKFMDRGMRYPSIKVIHKIPSKYWNRLRL